MEDWNSTTHWEPLTGGARVLVSREHTFGTDAVLLADFSAPRPGELWADLGTGCGVIPLLWHTRTQAGHITGVELQEKAAWQAQRSVEENGFSQRIAIARQDARDLSSLFPVGSLHGMACNPPYTAPGAGIASADSARRGGPPSMPCGMEGGCASACGPSGLRRRWRCSTASSWSPNGCGCASSGRGRPLSCFCWSAGWGASRG